MPLAIDLMNGEMFAGNTLGYFPNSFLRFETTMGPETKAYEGRLGDVPAMQTTAPDAQGLLVLTYQSTVTTLTYREWDKFMAFAAHKDFTNAARDHRAAGWPETGFREAYARYIKSLIAIGDGAGRDAPSGLETEFVALTNPYVDEFDGTMRVQVLYQGQPRSDAQVEVFARAPDGRVNVTLTRTDGGGIADIETDPDTEYLLDAVVLRPYEGPKTAVWETLWAALTFKTRP